MAAQPVLANQDGSNVADDAAVTGDSVLEVLGSERCRAILDAVGSDRLTADELAEGLAIPISTVYRHLGRLTDANLVGESVRVQRDGRHRSEYGRLVSGLSASFEDGLAVQLVPDAADA